MKKMYVLVRKELDPVYRCVQGCHALAKFSMQSNYEFTEWNNRDLIFVGTRFESGIIEIEKRLEQLHLNFSTFYEPDLEQVTALACYCQPSVFKDLEIA